MDNRHTVIHFHACLVPVGPYPTFCYTLSDGRGMKGLVRGLGTRLQNKALKRKEL